jgi:hypothetical protein
VPAVKKPAAKKAPAKTAAKRAQAKPGKAAPSKTDKKRKRTDWEAIERDYRAGKLTLREIGEKHGVSAGRVCQVADEKGWQRGELKEVVRKATTALLIAEHVEGEVNKVKQGLNTTILAEAELNKQVILRHRQDLGQTRQVAMDMLGELSLTTKKPEEIEALFEKVTEDLGGNALASAQQQFRDFMRLHSRIGSVHKLADTLSKLQERERKAYGLDDDENKPGTSLEDLLADVHEDLQGQ